MVRVHRTVHHYVPLGSKKRVQQAWQATRCGHAPHPQSPAGTGVLADRLEVISSCSKSRGT